MVELDLQALANNIRVGRAEDLARRYEENSGGVYAWHIPGPTDRSKLNINEINNYYSSLSDAISMEYAETPRSSISLSINKNPIKPSNGAREHEQIIKSFIDIVGLFSAPVYVGSTTEQSISERIRQHLKNTTFGVKLMEVIRSSGYSDNIYPEAMLIRYFPVDEILSSRKIVVKTEERKALIEQIEETIFSYRMPPLNEKRSR